MDSDLNEKYGIKIADVAIADINLTDESMKRVSKIDDATIFSDSRLQSGLMAEATADALGKASSNSGGAMLGMMGMNMASNAGATMMGAVNSNISKEEEKVDREIPNPGSLFEKKENVDNKVSDNVSSVTKEYPKFCPNCGTATDGGNFCTNCGNKLK